jgi:hypothetical protein
MRKNWLIDRRTCLKGLGVAMALPLLETMGWADPPRSGGAKAPVRLGFMFMPCGVNRKEFWPADPKTYPVTLPSSLEPLRPVIDQCLLLEGIDNVPHTPLDGAAHALELSSWLTATLPDPTKRDTVNIAPSADQIAAQQLGLYTALPSLELGTRKNEFSGTGQEGLNNRYYSTGNYRTATQPLPVEISPAEVLKRLFASRQSTPRKKGGPSVDAAKFAGGGAADEESLDRSMLDLVLDGAKNLRGRVSADDQRQLDDYLESVRSLEQRVAAIERQQAEAARAKAGKGDAGPAIARSAPLEVKIPAGEPKWSELVKVMGDLMILAFQTDITRVGTLIASMNHGVAYPELDFSDHHHECSHHDNTDQVKLAKVAKIDRFNLEQYAYLVGRMKGLREGAGTLLDNTIFMWGSGLGNGHDHTHRSLPCIIAGRGGGTIRTGRHVPKCNGNQGDLLTALLARAGVQVAKPVGIGTKLLPDLS